MPKLGSHSGGITAGQKDGTHSGRGRSRGRATSHMKSNTSRGSSRGRVRGAGHPARAAASAIPSSENAAQSGKQPFGGPPSLNSPFAQVNQNKGFGFAGITNGTSQFGKPSTASGSANSFQGFKAPSVIPQGQINNVEQARDPRRNHSETSAQLQNTMDATPVEDVKAMGGYQDRYEKLKLERARQRERAIKQGQMADPNQPTSLNKAITPVGMCTEMCPEFERVERIVQKMVDRSEKYLHPTSGSYQNMETKMLKRFRRSAAGYDEQLPSDIRTPQTLLQTMNYLTRHVLNGPEPLGLIHKFVWDRTRSIRNDLSVQQLTQEGHVRMAVLCLERIARFHIVSLHLLSSPANQEQFDHHQEREQLNNTMLSLMYYYDDNRDRISFPNEDEFRAYYIVLAIHDQRPDLETRVQNWPQKLLQSPKVQVALELFAAASNTWEYQGALDEKRPNAIAQGFYTRFFSVVDSPSVSYLMACVAEIYFNNVRQTAIRSIWKAYCRSPASQQHKNEEWTLDELTETLCFDDESQTERFCEAQGLDLAENSDGQLYLNWGSRPIESVDFQPSSQHAYSEVHVESKRGGRTLASIILGLNIRQAAKHGMIDTSLLQPRVNSPDSASVSEASDDGGLFVSEEENEIPQPQLTSNGESSAGLDDKLKVTESTSSLNAGASLISSGSNPVHDDNASNLFGRPSILSTEPKPLTASPFWSFPGTPQSKTPAANLFGLPSTSKSSSAESSQQVLNTSASNEPKLSFSSPALNPFAASFSPSSSDPKVSSPFVPASTKPFSIAAAISNGFSKPEVSQSQNSRPSSVFDSVPANSVFNNSSSWQLFPPIQSTPPVASSNSNPFGLPSTNKVSEVEDNKSPTPDSIASPIGAVSSYASSTSFFKTGAAGDEAKLSDPSISPVQPPSSNFVSSLTPKPSSPTLSSVATNGAVASAAHSDNVVTTDQSLVADPTADLTGSDLDPSYLSTITPSADTHSSEDVDFPSVETTIQDSNAFRTSWIDALRDTVRSKRIPTVSRKRPLDTEEEPALSIPEDSSKASKIQRPKPARPKKTSLALASIAPLPSLPILDEVKKLIQPKATSPSENETTTASRIDEDELLLSAARIAAESLKNGPSLLENVPNYSYSDPLRSSVRSEGSVHPLSDISRSQSPYSRINGYDVALAPESPLGLGRTLSRTEQRLRLTGGKGLAYKPLPSNLGRVTKKKSKKPLIP